VNSIAQKKNKIQLENLLIRTPLGVRFWDHGANEPVRDHLNVTAWPREGGLTPIHAVRNPSGIYAFHGLPGLRDWEYPFDYQEFESSPPISKQYILKIVDLHKWFLNVAAIVEAPQPDDDDRIYTTPLSSPADGDKGFRLFSAPTRPAKSHLAVVRAYLWDTSQNKQAAYAALKVNIGGTTWTGIADELGMIAIMFPYPMIMRALDVSPPSSRIPFHEQSWDITVRAFYGGTDMTPLPNAELPNLANILKQIQAEIYNTVTSPSGELLATLTLGQELVLRTRNTDKRNRSKLFIKPMNTIS
jgi:hypothetical protein